MGIDVGTFNRHALRALCALGAAAWSMAVIAQQTATTKEQVFATVGSTSITVSEFNDTLHRQARQRYFHFRPPPEQERAFRREVADQLIDRALVIAEAKRRRLAPTPKVVEAELEKYRRHMRARGTTLDENGEAWQALRGRLEGDQLVQQLRADIERQITPSEEALRMYYHDHPDKFTEPAQARVSLILLKVEPSAPAATWAAARTEAARLLQRLRAGGSFAELARLHSGDSSAVRGGDMGYLHSGMLAANVEQVIAKMEPGQVSEPLTVLEGIALVRLEARRPARLNGYVEVRERVRALWMREKQEHAWKAFIAQLREATPIRINEEYLVPAADDRTTGKQGYVPAELPGHGRS